MAKTMQVVYVNDYGKCYKVIRHFGDIYNPYWIYHEYNDFKVGRLVHHRKLMGKYANLASCFYWFLNHNIGF